VAWVDLARVQDRADVGAAVVDALGAQVTDPADAQATAAAMARFRGLVVLDNCEHLLEAVTDLLDRALREPASVRLLTTSRERLDLPGEQVLVIEPLPVPDPAGATARDPAVALFLERVLAAGGEPIAPAHAAAVVAAVDGLPLGLELAAARAVTLPVETLVTRLAADLQVLAGSARRYGDRQRTLVDVIAWSHDLLSDRERVLFRRLSVFAAAFGLQDAERVAADAALPPPAVVDGLARLVEQSMVARVGPDRYRLLEPLRRFAADALATAEDATATGRRHRELLVELVGRADVELPTRAEAATVVGLEQALPDLRAVHARALAAGDLGTVAQLAGQLYRFSYQQARGDLLAWGLPLVADGEGVPRDDRLRALTAATVVTQWRGDLDEARRLEALLAAVLHDEELAPWTGVHVAEAVGDVRLGLGDLEGAANAYARAGTLAGRLEHAGLLASATASLAIVQGFQGRVAEAERAAREACELAAEAGAPSVRSLAAYALGEALAPSEPDAALDAFDLARREASTVGARFFEGIARTADVALRGRHGDPHEALNRYRDALQVWHDAAADSFVLTTLRNLVVLLVRVGADAAAVTLDAALGRFARATATARRPRSSRVPSRPRPSGSRRSRGRGPTRRGEPGRPRRGDEVRDRPDRRTSCDGPTRQRGTELRTQPLQQRDGGELVLGELLPADPRRRTRAAAVDLHDPVRGDDEVDLDVVVGARDRPGRQHLQLVDGGGDEGGRHRSAPPRTRSRTRDR
jgi:predicted ATPase